MLCRQCVYHLVPLPAPNRAVTLSRSFVILTSTVPRCAVVDHSSRVGVLSGFPRGLIGVNRFAEAVAQVRPIQCTGLHVAGRRPGEGGGVSLQGLQFQAREAGRYSTGHSEPLKVSKWAAEPQCSGHCTSPGVPRCILRAAAGVKAPLIRIGMNC